MIMKTWYNVLPFITKNWKSVMRIQNRALLILSTPQTLPLIVPVSLHRKNKVGIKKRNIVRKFLTTKMKLVE